MGLQLPEKGQYPKVDKWVIVLGGSGSVGQYGVQVSHPQNLSLSTMN